MALPKANRLRHRQEFSIVYQKGIRRRSGNLALFALRQKQPKPSESSFNSTDRRDPAFVPQPTRVGISISQKVSKLAVVRNRIKRQIRAVMRQLLPRSVAGWSLVIVVQPQAIQCDYLQFLRELEQLLIDAEVLNGHS